MKVKVNWTEYHSAELELDSTAELLDELSVILKDQGLQSEDTFRDYKINNFTIEGQQGDIIDDPNQKIKINKCVHCGSYDTGTSDLGCFCRECKKSF